MNLYIWMINYGEAFAVAGSVEEARELLSNDPDYRDLEQRDQFHILSRPADIVKLVPCTYVSEE